MSRSAAIRDRMTTRQAQALSLRNAGLTYDAIAAALGITVPGVLRHLRHARHKPTQLHARILAAVGHELARTRCTRCGLLEPHECLNLHWLQTSRRG